MMVMANPPRRISREVGTVVSNEWASSRYKHLVVHTPRDTAGAIAGQFFYLRCSSGAVPLMRRPMSIYRIDRDKQEVHFLYLVKGEGTHLLANMKEGDGLDLLGPLGNEFKLDEPWSTILILARGVGLATLANLVELALGKGIQTIAVLSARTREDVLSADYMRSFGAKVHIVTEEDGNSDVDSVRQLVESLVIEHSVDAVFTCGSKRLTKLLQDVSNRFHIPGQVALEENMGCAMGVCFCCVRPFRRDGQTKYLRVCREGPVFALSEVIDE